MKKNPSSSGLFIQRVFPVLTLMLLVVLQSAPLYAGIAFKAVEDDITDHKKLESFLEDVRQRALASGISNFDPYSLLLVKESRRAVKEKEFDSALILADYAVKMSPDLPPAYEAKAEALWAKNRLFIYLPFIGYVQSFYKGLSHFGTLPFILLSNSSVIIFSCLLTSALFVLIILVRYFGLFFHDARHVFNENFPDIFILAGLLFMFISPLIFGLAAVCLIPFWLFLLFNYLNIQERLGATAVLLLFLIVPGMVSIASFGLKLPHATDTGLLWKINFNYWDKYDLNNLRVLSEDNPNDEDVLFTLGLAYKKNGDFQYAMDVYNNLAGLNHENHKIFTNLGNVYLLMNRWQDAVDAYKRAIKLSSGKCAAAHFNLSKAYGQEFLFDESEIELYKAMELESTMVVQNLEDYTEHYNRLVIDEHLSKSSLLNREGVFTVKDLACQGNLNSIFFKPVPCKYVMPAILFFYFVSVLLLKKDRFRIAKICAICGESLCVRCQKEILKDVICTQCQNYFRDQDHFDHELKSAKIIRIKKYQVFYKLIRNILGLFFPGAALIWKGYVLAGLFMLFVSACLFLKIVMLIIFESPWAFVGHNPLPLVVLLVAALFCCWGFSVLTTFKFKDKNLRQTLM
jgi:tetratricopeptide (TPR) repeat protein